MGFELNPPEKESGALSNELAIAVLEFLNNVWGLGTE
jgi:hypothetical protein